MKHMKVLSSEKPALADEVAPVQAKNVFGFGAGSALSAAQGTWVLSEIDQSLQK